MKFSWSPRSAPDLESGQILYERVGDHDYVVIATTKTGFHSGRTRFCVACCTCETLIHEQTTGPGQLIGYHERHGCSKAAEPVLVAETRPVGVSSIALLPPEAFGIASWTVDVRDEYYPGVNVPTGDKYFAITDGTRTFKTDNVKHAHWLANKLMGRVIDVD